MSKGNNNTYGNKKMNFPFQQALLQINGAIQAAAEASGTNLAQESTLISVLNAIVASHQDIEILLVRDEAPGNGDPVVKQVTDWQQGTPVVTYENVDGTTYVPTPNPPQYVYLDPSAILNLILAELITLNAGGQLAEEATLLALSAKFNSLGQKASADSSPVVLSAEQEALIDQLEALLTTIDADTSAINTSLAATVRTPGAQRITTVTSGNVAAGARSASFYNAHPTADANVGGAVLKPGEVIDFDAGGQQDTLAQINWSTLVAADLLITTVV